MKWLTDTLARRLFLLMWAALVVSHVAAFVAVRIVHRLPGQPVGASARPGLPTFPSLPPTLGLHLNPPPRPRPAQTGRTHHPARPPPYRPMPCCWTMAFA